MIYEQIINVKFLFKNYWIYKNKVIFKPNFNDKLDDYIDIISKHNELIFSNYDDFTITIKTNNLYYEKYYDNYKGSKFNQQITISQNITHLTFGEDFNQQVIIPQNITHLTFGDHFNQQVIIPQNVTHLTFGFDFNQQVIIPQNVTHLIFGYDFDFDQPVNLPNIKYIKLGCNNIDIIENLPNSVEEIEFDYFFDLELHNLPNSIKKISFCSYSSYDKELNCLPEFVEYLELGKDYDKKINKFPINLKTIKCNRRYKYINDLKDKYNVITY